MAGADEPTVGELHRTMTQLRLDTKDGFTRVEKAIAELHRDFVPTAVFEAKYTALEARVDGVAKRVDIQESESTTSRRATVTTWIAVAAALAGSGSWVTLMLK